MGEYDEELVKLALDREHAREGQSFYLHNRVETIDEAAEKLRQLCPDLRFLVAHGQMSERELEDRMHAFLAGDADVLVSTTIIESGIDIPQANTLIVERADALGLAQLYQIRGRVGRSDVTAHAYLFYPDANDLTGRGEGAPGDARRPHRARRRLPDRDARPRDPRRRRPPRSGAVGTRGRARLRALRRDARRGRGRALRAGSEGRAARYASTRASTRTSPPRTSSPRRSRSTSTAGSPWRSTRTSCASSMRRPRTATARCPSRSRTCSASRRRSWRSRSSGADYLVYRGGRATVGPVGLAADEVRALRSIAETAVYTSARQEVAIRTDGLEGALGLAAAIVAARRAA